MNFREWVYQRLASDEQLMNILPAGSVFGAGAVGEVPAAKPFVVLRHGPRTGDSIGPVGNLVVWAHDEPGDYGKIDEILWNVRRILDRVIPGEPGLITLEWTADSADLADDGYGTITKNSSYRLIETR